MVTNPDHIEESGNQQKGPWVPRRWRETKISRRNLLKGAAVGAGGLAVAVAVDCGPSGQKKENNNRSEAEAITGLHPITGEMLTQGLTGINWNDGIKTPTSETPISSQELFEYATNVWGEEISANNISSNPIKALKFILGFMEMAGVEGQIDLSKTFPNLSLTLSRVKISNLPNNNQYEAVINARPRNFTIRKDTYMITIGNYSEEKFGGRYTLVAFDDFQRKNPESVQMFLAGIPTAVEQQSEDLTSLKDILNRNGIQYIQDSKGASLALSKDKSVGVRELDAGFSAEVLTAVGEYFVHLDPLKKEPALHPNPIVSRPPESIVGSFDRIEQEKDGRIVAKDTNGNVIARAISQRGLDWRWTNKEHLVRGYSPSELADALDFKVAAMLLIQDITKPQYVEMLLSLANEVKIDDLMFDRRQFKTNIDWRKILDNWDTIQADFSKGVIPYESEVFNNTAVQQVRQLLSFSKRYGLDVIGSKLFWWSDYNASLDSDQFTADEKKKMQEFMAIAKVLKYPEIKRWVVASEVAFGEVIPWIPAKAKAMVRNVGGRQFVHDIATRVKELRPDVELTLLETELIVTNNNLFRQVKQRFFDMLDYFKQKGTPIDKIADEANYWIFDPPTESDIRNFIRSVKDSGYKVGASEMTIVQSDINPWRDRPKTVKSIADKEKAQAEIALRHFRAYLEEGAECGIFSGSDADSWWIHEGYLDSLPEMTDVNFNQKKSFSTVRDFLQTKVD